MGAKVTVSSSGLKPTTLRRPAERLYLFEVNGMDKGEGKVAEEDSRKEETTKGDKLLETRSRRLAAAKAEARRRQWIEDGSIE